MIFIRLMGWVMVTAAMSTAAGESRVRVREPVKNYAISFFSDEGYARVRVVGESADLADPGRIRLTAMELILYSGGADQEIETTLVAPLAFLEPEPEQVHGPEGLALSRPDLDLTGENWRYDHRERRVQIKRNARVVFKMPLADLLK